jgi:hypothetical protein
MDFIIELPISHRYSLIWIIISKITKIAHFIVPQGNTQKAKDLGSSFVRGILMPHSLLIDIILYYGY